MEGIGPVEVHGALWNKEQKEWGKDEIEESAKKNSHRDNYKEVLITR